MAGARQRLHDRGAWRASVRVDTPTHTLAMRAHFGVFADGVLRLSRSNDPNFVARLRIYNPDGSEAELSGNGAREAILYIRRHKWTDKNVFSIQTAAGAITPTITGPNTCRVDMGAARLTSPDFPSGAGNGQGELKAAGRRWRFQHVSIGNPQCAIHVYDFTALAGPRPGRNRARDRRAISSSRTAPTSPGTPRPNRSHPRADLRARRGTDACLRAPAPRARRWPTICAAGQPTGQL